MEQLVRKRRAAGRGHAQDVDLPLTSSQWDNAMGDGRDGDERQKRHHGPRRLRCYYYLMVISIVLLSVTTVMAVSSWSRNKQSRPHQQSHEDHDVAKKLDRRDFSSFSTETGEDLPFIIYKQSSNGSLTRQEFSTASSTRLNCQEPYLTLPVETDDDPFLPYLHDYFVTNDGRHVKFIAQNKRRCHTGRGQATVMAFWEPQMALFQPVGVRVAQEAEAKDGKGTPRYWLTAPENATHPETRFICRFHDSQRNIVMTTFSEYPFNYEYINWRKRGDKPMFVKDGPDVEIFDYSTLLFSCPIPEALLLRRQQQQQQQPITGGGRRLWLDLIPIRTPARFDQGYLLTLEQVGQEEFAKLHRFDTNLHYGTNGEQEIPPLDQSGRYENLPICLPQTNPSMSSLSQPERQLVGCTWAAASYDRRGGKRSIHDAPERLKEWIAFHKMVGFDHLFVYDNTQLEDNDTTTALPLKQVTDLFDSSLVTYIRWNAKVCNNNYIGGRWPGERSSQYAAEASCRERFGPLTQWMAFFDIDEYLVPMGDGDAWRPVLDAKKAANAPVLGMRSTRALPRVELMDESTDPDLCRHPTKKQATKESSCLVKKARETFLHSYNCDNVRPPRPSRYFTDMKQIYRPDFVLSHFVHYSCITKHHARYYANWKDPSPFRRKPANKEKYVYCVPARRQPVDTLFSFRH